MKYFLANEINSFCKDYDFYNYQDANCSFESIYNCFDIYSIIDYFKSYIDESEDSKIVNRAKLILNFLFYYERGEMYEA